MTTYAYYCQFCKREPELELPHGDMGKAPDTIRCTCGKWAARVYEAPAMKVIIIKGDDVKRKLRQATGEE